MKHRTKRGCVLLASLTLLVFLFTMHIAPSSSARPVSAAAPTPPAGPAIARFAGASIKTTAPEGTIQQIELRLGGGGYPGCLDAEEAPTLNYYNDNLELTDITIIATCGWQADETVRVTLMDPLGKITTTEVKAVPARQKKGVYEVDIFYQPGVDALPGKYRFMLQGSGMVKAKITYLNPTKARLYALPEDRFQPYFTALGGKHRLRLHGFLPNEPVRMLAYRFEGAQMKFYGWQDFATDRRGQIIIETDLPDIGKDTEMNFYAYGRDTHFVALERFTPNAASISRQIDMDLYCPGALAPRLSGPAPIRPAGGIEKLGVYQQPGFGSRVVTQASAGDALRTYGYPKCIDRAFWWQVSLNRLPMFGWTAESFLGKYLVEAAR
jgi:hypothetical protein